MEKMEVDVIAITTKEYKELIEAKVRIDVFSDFVISERYSIPREACARYLGFEVEEEEE